MLQFILKYGEIFKVDEYSHKARIYLQYLFLWLNLYAECLSIGLTIAIGLLTLDFFVIYQLKKPPKFSPLERIFNFSRIRK